MEADEFEEPTESPVSQAAMKLFSPVMSIMMSQLRQRERSSRMHQLALLRAMLCFNSRLKAPFLI